MNWIEKGPTDCWPWIGSADEAPNKNNKMACDNQLCCNQRHVVKQVPPKEPAEEKSELDALREKAASLGIKVDKRWKEDRLQQEIEAAQ